MKVTIEIVIVTIIAILILIGVGILWEETLSGQEQYECQQWQAQSQIYKNFYLAKWQKQQCDSYKIIINAPVQ